MINIFNVITASLLLLLVLFSCENEGNSTKEELPLESPSTVVDVAPQPTPAPLPEPVAIPDSILEQVVIDSTPKKAVRAERPVRKPPKIVFKQKSYMYDTIQQGDIVEYEFEFQNKGERPLTIKDVKGSCGCTIGSYPFLDIAPDEKNTIKARFDSKGKVGPQFTTITVYSNANPKGDVLSLKGVVAVPKEK